MEASILKFIYRYSKPQQLVLLTLIALSFPFLYYSLDLPKIIINKAIGGKGLPKEFLGFPVDQIEYLLVLCGIFLALVFVNGGFKFLIHVYQGIVGERMLRRLRFQLVTQLLRFPLPYFRSVSQGEAVAMVSAEAEALGGFVGEAFVTPAFEGGQMLVILVFMFIQDWRVGVAAIALFPVQMIVIPLLQRKVNMLAKERVKAMRKLAERLGELVSGVADVHAHGTAQYELAEFGGRLGLIYHIRYRIYVLKFFIKFLNGFFDKLTPFLFFSIGGWLVIQGDLTLGALVAALAAYKDIAPHFKELLNYFQHFADSQIKYQQLVERFQPQGLLDERLLAPSEDAGPDLAGRLVTANLSLVDEEGNKVVDGASFAFDTSRHVALVGPPGSGKTELAQLLARQLFPSSGSISIEGHDLTALPESVTGRRISYVDQDSYIGSGTIRDSLLYALKHHPRREPALDEESRAARAWQLKEALLSGNSPFDINADWIDYDLIGVKDRAELSERLGAVLRTVGLDADIFRLGLRRIVSPGAVPELCAGVLEARGVIHRRLKDAEYAGLVEIFGKDRFNSNASVAENILFGTPVGGAFDVNNLAENAYILQALERADVTQDFLEMGRATAAVMVELFQDLPPGHEFFERFSFIDSESLPHYQSILSQVAAKGLAGLDAADRTYLMNLPFKLIPARHRLDLIGGERQRKLLEARRAFSEVLPDDLRASIEFFEVDRYNAASSILDNLLFGKIVADRPDSAERIGELIDKVADDIGLRPAVIEVGLDYDVGVGGKRLNAAQRQKVAVARAMIKNPQILISNEAVTALDAPTEAALLNNIRKTMKGRGLVWVKGDSWADGEGGAADTFEHVFFAESGRLRERKRKEEAVAPAAAARAAQPAEEAKASGLGKDAELLAGIPFFAGLDRHKLKLLAFTSERQKLDGGEVLFSQGDQGELAYVIVDGDVDVVVSTVEGPVKVAAAGRGDLIGELALLCDAPRTATIKAVGPVSFLKIAKDVFLKLIEDNPQVSLNVTRIVAGRLERMMRGIDRLRQPLYDEITGLPNRNLFLDRVKHALSEDRRAGKISALMLFHLSEFDNVGERIGAAGEIALLQELARRLRHSLREADSVARLDGFTFGIIAKGAAEMAETELVLQRVRKNLAAPFLVGGQELVLKQKINFDFYPLDDQHAASATEHI
jgi:diguanylate cyclase (GGDEF)-like protein